RDAVGSGAGLGLGDLRRLGDRGEQVGLLLVTNGLLVGVSDHLTVVVGLAVVGVTLVLVLVLLGIVFIGFDDGIDLTIFKFDLGPAFELGYVDLTPIFSV